MSTPVVAHAPVAIVGVGDTVMGKHPSATSMELHLAAARSALHDAGIEPHDVDGVLTAGTRSDGFLMHSVTLAEQLGIRPTMAATLALGGAVHASAIHIAVNAIRAGTASTILVAAGDNIVTAPLNQSAVALISQTGAGHPDFENPFGASVPSLYGLMAQRHMHEYGTTLEQMAHVAVSMRRHALRHPHAHMRKPITLMDVMDSKPIASPLRLLDCCPISDGAGAFVLQSVDRANARQRAVRVLGMGEGHGPAHILATKDPTRTAAAAAAARAYGMAGLTAADIDVAFPYDSFTISLICLLEDLGFCAKGEGGAFVEGDALDLGGRLPCNTHGGLLSHGHPGKAGGIFHIIEAVRQLRAEAETRQVQGAEIALVHGSGGVLASHSVTLLGAAHAE